jgi:hypothetical protein
MEKEYIIYKPRNSGDGGALKLSYNIDKNMVFVEYAPQIKGEKKFDWPKKITVKMSADDLGKMKSVFEGRLKSIQSYHKTKIHNTNIELSGLDKGGWAFKLSRQFSNKDIVRGSIAISPEEGSVLTALLNYLIPQMVFRVFHISED